ncbi:MAG: S-layer homology domain-containing protein [Candidatus Aquicultor sp.]
MAMKLILLCATTLLTLLLSGSLLGSPAISATYSKQDLTPQNSTEWIDAQEGGYAIDVARVGLADDGQNIAFMIRTYQPFDKSILENQHIYFFLDADQNLNTSIPALPGTGVDRMVEIQYVVQNNVGKLAAIVHDGHMPPFAASDEVTQTSDGTMLFAYVPVSSLGATKAFNWCMEVYDERLQIIYDSVPDDGFASYTLYAGSGDNGSGGSGGGSGGSGGDSEDNGSNESTTVVEGDTVEPTHNTASINFNDIWSNDWFYTDVMSLVDSGVANGYSDGSFRPQNNITRAEFCKMILTALGQKPDTNVYPSFNDTVSHWASAYIEKAKQLGITDGYAGGVFKPNNYVTRAEICKMICNAKNMDLKNTPSRFTDCSGHWADTYISTLRETGILSGYTDGTFRPQNRATRAEACKIISLMLHK